MLRERTTTEKLSVFRSAQGEVAYASAYDALLSLWPVPCESIYVETPFGVTHALVAGPEEGKPLILLPAVSNSAASWFQNINGLSETRRVYAIDVIGDAGKSTLERRLQRRPEIADWLTAVFDGLDLDRPAVAGHSYGGWLALNLALYAPQSLGRLVLIAPAASLRPFRFVVQAGLRLPHLPQWFPFQPSARSILQSMVTGDYCLNERFVDLMEATVRHTTTHLLFPTVFSDEELRQIKVPTLIVLGEEEIIYDPREALARARRLIPDLETALIPNASHLLTMQWSTTVNRQILEFLEDRATAPGVNDRGSVLGIREAAI
jgi:pimeloyl-ACP methyl ester carboxylesterase